MRTNFNIVYFNDLKKQLEGTNQPARFFDSFSLQTFLNDLTREQKEKIFSFASQSIIDDIHASLTQVLTLSRRNKTEKSRLHYYPLPKEAKDTTDSSWEEVEAISVCEFTDLNFFYEDPYFKHFVESLALLNRRNYSQSKVQADLISKEELRKFILNEDYLLKKKPLVKIIQEKLDNAMLYSLQNVIPDFGQGFKHVLSKENEEKLYFNITNGLMYQLNSTGKFVRHNVATYISKLYASFLSVAMVFENKLLRKYEKHLYKRSLASREAISSYLKKTVETIKGIHVGNLVIALQDCSEEEEGYQDTQEANRLKNQWVLANDLAASEDFESQTTQDSYDEENEVEEAKLQCDYGYDYYEGISEGGFHSYGDSQRGNRRRSYGYQSNYSHPSRGNNYQAHHNRNNRNQNYYYPSNYDNEAYYANNGNNHYYNYNSNYRGCGFGDDYKKAKRYNHPKHHDYYQYEFVKME